LVEVAQFKSAMRRLVSGVCLITTRTADGQRHGLTATAVTSVAAEPPSLLCCVNQSASAALHIRDSACFGVNVLPVEATEMSQRFSGAGPSEMRFTFGRWTTLETGAPILEDAIAAFDCKIAQHMEVGTHFVFLGLIQAVHVSEQPAQPLLYGMGGYGVFQPA